MSKKLNFPLALGIFLIGLFSANVSQAQSTNVYWKPSTGLGGAGTWNSGNAFWSTNSDGSGTLSSPTTLGTNIIYNFSGTAGSVNETSSFTNAGVNWLTSGYTWTSGANRTLTGVDQTATGTNAVNIGNNANLIMTGVGFTFDAMAMTGGAGSTVTLTNATGATTTVIFGTSAARSGRTNSVNTIISGAGTVVLGSQGNNGFTQAGNINNNSTGTFVLTNSGSGNIVVSGVVSGTGGLTLNNTNTGKIFLSAANTYTGGTTINSFIGGEIIFSNATSFGTGTITSSGSGTNFVRSGVDGLNLTNALVINAGNTLRMGGTSGTWSNIVSGPISGAGAILYNPSGLGSMYLTGLTNSFGGGVNVGNGTLYFNKLGSNGENSSLGTSGTITVGGGTTTGGLRWNGTANEISDKTIVLAGTTGGLNLYAEGATGSSLTINGDINSTGSGAKTLNFAGYKDNTLTLNGLINENGGVNSVVIGASQSGTVVLGNANNSFSGAIRITNSSSSTLTVLSVANIGMSNAVSALGRNGTINMAGTTGTAITALKYTGTGETSDKVINFVSAVGGAILDQSGTGNLKFTSPMTATGVGAKAITLQGSTAGTGEIAGAISDLGGVTSLTKSGTGAWTLSGNNSNSGLTTVTAGTLTLSGNNSTASGGVTLTAGTLNVNGVSALGTGTLTLTASSVLNNTSGTAVVNSGNNAVVWTGTTPGAFTVGTLNSNEANSLDLGTGTVTASASRSLNILGTGNTFKMGTLENTSSTSSRTFTFDGAGNNMVLRGFKITTTASVATSANLDGSANLEIAGVIQNGNLLANGVVIKGTGAKTFSGANTYTGETEIVSGATLNYGANDVTLDTGGRMYVNGGTLNIGSYNDTVSSVRVNAGGAINGTGTLTTTGTFTLADNNVVNANLAGAMTISKTGQGLVSLLNGNNTYGGTTTVSSGTLKLGSNTALGSTGAGTSVQSTGFLDLNGKTVGAEALTFTGSGGLLNSSVTAASLSGNVAIGDTTSVNTTGDITLSGNLTGIASKSLTKEGSGILKLSSSGSTLAGTLKVSEGTLLVTGNGNVSTSSSIVDGGTLRVNGTAGSVSVNAGGSLEGSGNVGALTLVSGAFLKPGNSPGLLTASLASWEAGSTYNWEIDQASGGTAGVNWDVFSVVNALDLSALSSSAKMNLVLNSLASVDDFNPNSAYSWVFAQAGSFIGTDLTDGANVTDLFNITAGTFAGDVLPTTGFKVEVGTDSVSNLRTLSLTTIPEPSTGSMFGLGFAGLVVTRLLRRKIG